MDGMYRNTKFFVFLRALDREIAALPQRETAMGRNGAHDHGACAVMRRFGKQGGIRLSFLRAFLSTLFLLQFSGFSKRGVSWIQTIIRSTSS